MKKKIIVRQELLNKITDDAQLDLYKKALNQFINHNSNGANLEKLHGNSNDQALYSIRVNREARLILTVVDGQWLWIDALAQHEYDTLMNRPSTWLDHKIQKTQDEPIDVESLINDASKDEVLEVELEVSNQIEYCHQRFIILGEQQEQAKKTSLPLVISGAPGSGKSSVLLSILHQQVVQHAAEGMSDENKKYFLILTQSSTLIKFLKDEWNSLSTTLLKEISGYQVDFKTPADLFNEQTISQPKTIIGLDAFKSWFKTHVTNKQIVSKDFPLTIAQAEKVYHEMWTMSGYSSYADYDKSVGERYSLFPREMRDALWEVYHKYLEVLRHNKDKEVDLSFLPIVLQQHYSFVGVDEGQDFSRILIKSLLLAMQDIVICIGDHQRLLGSESTVPYIKSVHPKEVCHISLKDSYRCPERITKLANGILQMKYLVQGSMLFDKTELRFIHEHKQPAEDQGQVAWYSKHDELKEVLAYQQNADFAVITTQEYLTEAEKLFGKGRVFTPDTIKGLEYKYILLYRLFEQPDYLEASAKLNDSLVLQQNPTTVAKNNEGTIQYNRVFNELFVAFTRAQASLFIYQPSIHKLRQLCNPLINLSNEINQEKTITPAAPVASSVEAWKEEVKKLIRAGNITQAQDTWVAHISPNLDSFLADNKQELGLQPSPPVQAISHDVNNNNNHSMTIAETNLAKVKPDVTTAANLLAERITTKHEAPAPTKIPTAKRHDLTPISTVQTKLSNKTHESAKRLLANFTVANLKKYVGSTPVDIANNLLIGVGPENIPMIELICNNKTMTTILLNVLMNKANQISSETLDKFFLQKTSSESKYPNASLLYWVCFSEFGLNVIYQLLDDDNKIRHLANCITAEDFLAVVKTNDNHQNTSVFYSLTLNKHRRKFLRKLFDYNTALYQYVTGENLVLAPTVNSGTVANCSALFWLSVSDDTSREILKNLIELNDQLAQTITAEALTRIKISTGSFNNYSALFGLSVSPIGRTILKMLFEKNSTLATHISFTVFGQQIPRTDEYYPNDSLVNRLTMCTGGIEILEFLFKQNAILPQLLNSDCLVRTVVIINDTANPVFNLSASFQGRIMLKMLLEKNRNLAKKFTKDVLFSGMNFPEAAGMYNLFVTSQGCEILKLILKLNPDLAREISKDDLVDNNVAVIAGRVLASKKTILSRLILLEEKELIDKICGVGSADTYIRDSKPKGSLEYIPLETTAEDRERLMKVVDHKMLETTKVSICEIIQSAGFKYINPDRINFIFAQLLEFMLLAINRLPEDSEFEFLRKVIHEPRYLKLLSLPLLDVIFDLQYDIECGCACMGLNKIPTNEFEDEDILTMCREVQAFLDKAIQHQGKNVLDLFDITNKNNLYCQLDKVFDDLGNYDASFRPLLTQEVKKQATLQLDRFVQNHLVHHLTITDKQCLILATVFALMTDRTQQEKLVAFARIKLNGSFLLIDNKLRYYLKELGADPEQILSSVPSSLFYVHNQSDTLHVLQIGCRPHP